MYLVFSLLVLRAGYGIWLYQVLIIAYLFTLQIFCSYGALWAKCLSEKRNNSVNYSQNFMKSQSGHLHHVPNLYVWYHDRSSSDYPDIFLHNVAFQYKMPKSEKGDNSAKYLQNLTKTLSGHLHLGQNLYAKYHNDPSSCGSPHILFTRLHRFTKRGIALLWQDRRKRKSIRFRLFSCLFHILNFKILSLRVFYRILVDRTGGQIDGQAQTNTPTKLLRSWGNNKTIWVKLVQKNNKMQTKHSKIYLQSK